MSLILNLLLIAFSVYMFYRVFQLSGRGRLNKEMLKILDKMDDRDAFFANADEFINVSKDPEYGQKVRVLRLWGDVFYERDEEFKEHLEDLNIDILLQPTKKNQGFANNEDSFFYLYMAIPNRLNYRGRNDLRRLHEAETYTAARLRSMAGEELSYPVKTAKKPRRIEEKTVLLLRCGTRYAIRKRPGSGMLAGLWEFPNADGRLTEEAVLSLVSDWDAAPLRAVPFGSAKHIFTHVEWHMSGFLVDCAGESPFFLWRTPEEISRDYSLPTAFRAFQKKISGV